MLVSELDQLIHSRSKLFRLYQAAKQGDRTAQEQYVTALTDAVPSVLHLVLMPSCAQTSGAPSTATPVRKGHDFDVANLERYLAGQIASIRGGAAIP